MAPDLHGPRDDHAPGSGLFYGGLVRRKNVLSTIMHSFFGLAIVSIVWVLIGFSIAFAPDASGGLGLFGGLEYVGFMNVGLTVNETYGAAAGVPFVLFAAFQPMFLAITPALITGAFAERKRFASFVVFTILWSIFVYSPIAHWVWARMAGSSKRARSTSPVAPSSTPRPVSPP